MTPLQFTLITLVASVFAGLFGSLLGLGGGVIITPVLTLFLGVDIKYAIGASIISVIATSSGSAAAYVKEHMTNLRVAMLLEVGTTAGALTGAFLAGVLNPRYLFVIFGLILGYSSLMMFRKRKDDGSPVPPDKWADALRLHDHYYDYHEQARDRVPGDADARGIGVDVCGGRGLGAAGDRIGIAESTGARFGDAPADQSFDRNKQLHDGRHGRSVGRRLFRSGKHQPVRDRPSDRQRAHRRDHRLQAALAHQCGGHSMGVCRGAADRVVADAEEGNLAMSDMPPQQMPGPVEEPPLVHRVELAISYLLRAGVLLSIALVVLGSCLTFARHPEYATQRMPVKDVPTIAQDFPHTIAATVESLVEMHGQGFILLGLLVLLVTPVMRVAVSIVAFAIQKDRAFTIITTIVLVILLVSFFLGRVSE